MISSGELLDEYEKIGPLDRACEYLMLGMRTVRGISRQEYTNIYRGGFDAIEDALRDFASVCEKYLLCHLERNFSTLDFYRSVCSPI